MFLRGGRGGKGNSHYATSINQAPRYAQKGIEGETRELRAELHLIADIGLVGMPNAGKSTLLSVLTNAHPLIGDYPFTTRTPNLGLLRLPERDVILADIPGIIEGASQGRGLGLKFLRHIERCAALLFLVDLSAPDCPGTVKVLAGGAGHVLGGACRRGRAWSSAQSWSCPSPPAGRRPLPTRIPRGRFTAVSSFSREGLAELIAAIRTLVGAAASAVPARDPGGTWPGRRRAPDEGGRPRRNLQPGALRSPVRGGGGAGTALGYDTAIFVPANQPVHKDPAPVLDPAHRLAMLRLAVRATIGSSWTPARSSAADRRIPLKRSRASSPGTASRDGPGFVIGDDLVAGFPSWKNVDELVRIVDLIVARRTLRARRA